MDVVSVTARPLDAGTKTAIATDLSHESLPCPARVLEYVQYARSALAQPGPDPTFDLELSDGAGVARTVAFAPNERPVAEGAFWYVLDRAQLRDTAIVLFGSPTHELIAPIPEGVVRAALVESLRWHLTAGVALSDDAALNACRSLRRARTRSWTDKESAGRWLLSQQPPTNHAGTIAEALEARAGGPPPARAQVNALLTWCLQHIET